MGTVLKQFRRDVMEAGFKAAWSLYKEEAQKNPEFARIFEVWKKYREQILQWHALNEASFEASLYNLSRQQMAAKPSK